MEKDLQQLADLPGVHGVFVCNNAGDAVASSDPPVLATVAMSTFGREVVRVFSALEAAGHPATRLEFSFDTWRLFARDFADGLLLAVCGAGGLDSALLRMSADVAVAGWRKDAKAQKRLAGTRERRSALLTRPALDESSWAAWSQLKVGA